VYKQDSHLRRIIIGTTTSTIRVHGGPQGTELEI